MKKGDPIWAAYVCLMFCLLSLALLATADQAKGTKGGQRKWGCGGQRYGTNVAGDVKRDLVVGQRDGIRAFDQTETCDAFVCKGPAAGDETTSVVTWCVDFVENIVPPEGIAIAFSARKSEAESKTYVTNWDTLG